ncbi:MAG: hypothetical protein VKK42_07990 [Lyngbya sp.]|nr:hypothetical protein [Lyngbya sp.]
MKFNNPKLTLFAFHLRNNFTQEEPVEDADFLWEQCQQLGKHLNIPRLQSLRDRLYKENDKIGVNPYQPKSNYLQLLQPEGLLKFSAIPKGSQLQLKGEVYPLQIHDSYAVDITLRLPYLGVQLEQLQNLNPQGCLQLQQSVSLLGQTLVFFAQPDSKIENVEAVANDCLTSILPEQDRDQYDFLGKGTFLGSPIFEYKPINEAGERFNSIFIWLNCSSETEKLEKKGKYYQPLINLLCCLCKIDYVYSLSRGCNKDARKRYRELAAELQQFNELSLEQEKRLEKLKTWLLNLPKTALEYDNLLRDLELHQAAIETNYKNYKSWLEQLQAIALLEDDLKFWQLTTDSIDRFLEQIKIDLAYLRPNQSLFQQAIDTIRGTVEIEQAEIDRFSEDAAQNRQQRLELLVTVVSTGLAVSGISSQVANEPAITILSQWFPGYFSPNPQPTSPDFLFSSFSTIAFHLFLGILVAIPFGAIVWSLQTNLIGKILRVLKKS